MNATLQILFLLSAWWCGLTNFLTLWILWRTPRDWESNDQGAVFRYMVAMSVASIAVTAGIATVLR